MHVIVVTNQKGGVGKTTTSLALAALFRGSGKRTLLIDTDPQGNATDTYGAKVEGEATLYDVILDSEKTGAFEAVQRLPMGDIIASDPLMRKGDEILASDVEGVYRMSDALEGLRGEYDVVVIDTAPALNMVLYNCLVAADSVVVPVSADRYSIAGLSRLEETVRAIRRRQNPKLAITGLLLTKYSGRTNLSKSARDALDIDAGKIGTKLFDTHIRECVKCQEAQAMKRNLYDYAPSCTTAEDYRIFYEELCRAAGITC